MDSFVITIAFLLIGVALRRIPDFSSNTGKILNSFVIYISLPALVLLKIPELTFSNKLLVPAFMPWGMLLISWALILIFSKLLSWERETKGCLMLLIPLGNTSFLGIPMVKVFFGEHSVPYALLYDQIGSFMALAIYGSIILAYYGTERGENTIKSVIKKVVLFPPFIALVLAFIIKDLSYPSIVVNFLKLLASTLIPLVMIAVGFQLSLKLNVDYISKLSFGLSIKMIAAPAVALFVCRTIGLEGESVNVSIFEAGMPPMVSAGALAISADLSPVLAAALVGIGIVASFVTLPILYFILA